MDADRRRTVLKWLFALYVGMMLWLLLFRRLGSEAVVGRHNLQPLDTVRRYLWVLRHSSDTLQRQYALANLLGNVVLFVPFGVFLLLLFEKLHRLWSFLLLTFAVISGVEILQTVTGLGALDVDDLVLNLIGTILGFLAWKLWQKRQKNKNQTTLPGID